MKRLIAALAFALVALPASADFVSLQGGTVIPGQDTGVYGEQTCPPPVGCNESGSTALLFNVFGPGTMSLAFIGVLDPSSTGQYTFNVHVFNPFAALIATGLSVGSLNIPSFGLIAGDNYLIVIDWQFSGDGTTQSAAWGVVAATAAAEAPEPGTLLLLSLGLAGIWVARRKGVA